MIGTTFLDVLELFNADPGTEAILMIGEIGGTAEEEAAAYIKAEVRKPVAAFIAGATAPEGKRMGHAGAIISGGKGTAAEKKAALRAAGIAVADSPADMGSTLASVYAKGKSKRTFVVVQKLTSKAKMPSKASTSSKSVSTSRAGARPKGQETPVMAKKAKKAAKKPAKKKVAKKKK